MLMSQNELCALMVDLTPDVDASRVRQAAMYLFDTVNEVLLSRVAGGWALRTDVSDVKIVTLAVLQFAAGLDMSAAPSAQRTLATNLALQSWICAVRSCGREFNH